MKPDKIPNVFLTVVIRDDSPFVFLQEPCEHRTVKVEFTPEQLQKLKLKWRGTNCGIEIYEDIGQAFFEYKPEVGE